MPRVRACDQVQGTQTGLHAWLPDYGLCQPSMELMCAPFHVLLAVCSWSIGLPISKIHSQLRRHFNSTAARPRLTRLRQCNAVSNEVVACCDESARKSERRLMLCTEAVPVALIVPAWLLQRGPTSTAHHLPEELEQRPIGHHGSLQGEPCWCLTATFGNAVEYTAAVGTSARNCRPAR